MSHLLTVRNVKFVKSQVVNHECRFIWELGRFSEKWSDLSSAEINPGPGCRTVWRFNLKCEQVRIGGFSGVLANSVTVSYTWKSSIENKIGFNADLEISIKNSEGRTFLNLDHCVRSLEDPYGNKAERQGANQFPSLEFPASSSDVLIVELTIKLYKCCITTVTLEPLSSIPIKPLKSSGEIIRVIELKWNRTDHIVLVTDDIMCPVHKIVLSSRWPSLLTLFESKGDEVLIALLSSGPYKEGFIPSMVSALYTDGDISETLLSMIQCATIYNLSYLMENDELVYDASTCKWKK